MPHHWQLHNVVPSTFLFSQQFVIVCQRLLAYGVGRNNTCTLFICCEIPPLVLLGLCTYFLSLCCLCCHLFQKVKGFAKLCATTQGERLQAFPHMLINTMSLGIVISMVNGWTTTHQFWPLNKCYLMPKLPKTYLLGF
jgi:hypothetical protein